MDIGQSRMRIHYCDYEVSEMDTSKIFRPGGSQDYLFLYFLTPMRIRFGQSVVVTKPGACILYSPNMCQDYQGIPKFRNSYIHFEAERGFAGSLSIPLNEVFYLKSGEKINQYIQKIHAEFLTRALYYEEQIDHLLNQMWIEISRQLHEERNLSEAETNLYKQFRKVRYEILSNCEKDWNVDNMSNLANMSKSQFYTYYKRFFHLSPKADLIHTRMEKARNLLTNEELSIAQAAQMCGFSNMSHFTRYFKNHTGCTPGVYRRTVFRQDSECQEINRQ